VKGRIKAVCRSDDRNEPKTNIGFGELQPGWGLVGDSHAGPPHPGRWQISLLAWEDVDQARRAWGIAVVPGSFAENLSTEGLDTAALQAGDRLQVGDQVVLEVEQLGKPPELAHTYSFQGHSLLPSKGVFCRVVSGGAVAVGDGILLLRPE
jgi:MOSC domain-containing protein YiiM